MMITIIGTIIDSAKSTIYKIRLVPAVTTDLLLWFSNSKRVVLTKINKYIHT